MVSQALLPLVAQPGEVGCDGNSATEAALLATGLQAGVFNLRTALKGGVSTGSQITMKISYSALVSLMVSGHLRKPALSLTFLRDSLCCYGNQLLIRIDTRRALAVFIYWRRVNRQVLSRIHNDDPGARARAAFCELVFARIERRCVLLK